MRVSPLYQQMIYARNTLKDQLSTIAGVGNITLAGYVDPNLRIWVDLKKLYNYDLISTDLVTAIQDEQIEQPAGRIESELTETNIRVLGEANSPANFGLIRINNRAAARTTIRSPSRPSQTLKKASLIFAPSRASMANVPSAWA